MPPSPAASSAPPAPAEAPVLPGATVQRPEPGLARGAVEAKPWVILVVAGAFVAAALVYGARRSGLWARLRRNVRR